MKPFLAAATLCLVLSLNGLAQQAPADSAATKEDVEKYLQTIHVHEMVRQVTEAMCKPMRQMAHEQFLKDKDHLPADFETRMNKIVDDMMTKMPYDEMIDAMVPTYQKHLTKTDIDALIAFYSSPTGQKILRDLPSIMEDGMQAMMPIMRKQIESMKETIQQQVAEMTEESKKNRSQDSKN